MQTEGVRPAGSAATFRTEGRENTQKANIKAENKVMIVTMKIHREVTRQRERRE